MALSIGVGVLDGFGLAMFLPLLKMVDDASMSDNEGLGKIQFLMDAIISTGLDINLFSILLVMSLFFILKGVIQYFSSMYEVNLRHYFVRSIRIGLTKALAKMSYVNFVKADAGRIQNTMSGEVSRISLAYQSYFGAFQQIALIGVYMLFAFFIDAKFALLICVGGGLTNFIYRRLYLTTKITSRKLTYGRNHYQGLILQLVSNFKYLKATGYVKPYNKKLKNTIHLIEKSNKTIGKLGAIINSIREPVLILIVSTVILIQVNFLGGSLGPILISLLFFYRALSAMILLQTHYNKYLEVSGSMENMTSFESELKSYEEKKGERKFKRFKRSIQLHNAGFYYSNQSILQNINLEIKKNQTVALVGQSGSGKTTLINILTGLMGLNEGTMLVDGIKATELNLKQFQKRIGYITQEPVIFNDTIYNNISFWAAPTPKNLARFEWAIKQASIYEFIQNLEEKENMLLGHNGINLSGGQKQRISIARELYKDIDILVLDEATSSLDSETEEYIQKGLENLHGNYTMIIVAHRLSTIRNADYIFLLNNGKIIDEGKFENLVSSSLKFKKMVELQEV
ncbi:ABC transporter ATP-binding protein [Gillisia mitskevichiae]|nr:ABC transporter ATP-binding protein [Gillisia mitskevichiae]